MAERRGDGSGQNSLNETANRRAKVRTRLLPERERERERGEGGLVARNHADRLANEQNSPEQLRELLSRRFQLLFSFLLFVVVAFLRRS